MSEHDRLRRVVRLGVITDVHVSLAERESECWHGLVEAGGEWCALATRGRVPAVRDATWLAGAVRRSRS